MAVEARQFNHFPPQLIIRNRDHVNINGGNAGIYDTQMGSGAVFAGTMPETILPFHQSLVWDDSVPVKTSVKSESGVTYNYVSLPRKRSRSDSLNQTSKFPQQNNNNLSSELSSFRDHEYIPLQIHQQQLEIDLMVAEHAKKIRLEVAERQKQHARKLVSAIGEGMMKKLTEKEEQIQRMGKLNWVLQERVNSLYVENQLWKDLAQTNEATANSLRTNLEQVLAHLSHERLSSHAAGGGGRGGVSATDDAESCCDSSDHGKRDREEEEEEEEGGERKEVVGGGGGGGGGMCRKCGERESRVLVLPCRHLCLCSVCGSTLTHNCPVCNCYMNASLHVNMS